MALIRMVLLGLMIVLAAPGLSARGVKMTELNEERAGQAATVVTGGQVRVRLREAGGTGYRWRVGSDCDSLLHLDETRMEGASGTPGASVSHVWIYTARSEGQCELRFESVRSWEKTVTEKTIAFSVTVHKAS